MRIALVQTRGVVGDVDGNIAFAKEQIEKIVREEGSADVVVFPEFFLTGYFLTKEQVAALAQDRERSMALKQMHRLAARHNVALVYGYPERAVRDGVTVVYNSAQLVSSQGRVLLNYRKQHLFGAHERVLFTEAPNEAPMDAMLNEVKVTLGICYDIEFPEFARLCALRQVKILFVPTASFSECVPQLIVPTRAIENHLMIVYCNRCGKDTPTSKAFCGLSCIVDGSGEVLVQCSGDDTTAVRVRDCEWDSAQCVEAEQFNPYLTDRRPELYQMLHNCNVD